MKEALAKIATVVITLWSSRRLWMTLMGVSILYGLYWHSGYHFSKMAVDLPAEKVSVLLPVLNSMYQTIMWGIVTAVGTYLGFTTLDKFTHASTSLISVASEAVSEVKKIDVTEKIDVNVIQKYADKYKDDPSYRPLDTIPDLDAEEFR